MGPPGHRADPGSLMRVGDLISHFVRTSDGQRIGRVFDVEAAVDESPGSGPGASLRVTRLFAGAGSSILRLGFHRRDVQGPLGVRFLARRLKGYVISWDQVESVEDEIVLNVPENELEELGRRT